MSSFYGMCVFNLDGELAYIYWATVACTQHWDSLMINEASFKSAPRKSSAFILLCGAGRYIDRKTLLQCCKQSNTIFY